MKREQNITSIKNHPLRVERELRGWSQAKAAEAIGTSIRTVARWERGEVIPQPFYRERICEIFEKNAQELGMVSPSNVQTPSEIALQSSFSTPAAMISPHIGTNATTSFNLDEADTPSAFHDPLLTTKFFVPVATHELVKRTRLTDLLNAGTKHTLTLLSAPAGFGKTTAIAEWLHSSPPLSAAWVSLDEEDNDPVRFWLYVLTALDTYQPGMCTPLITALRSQQVSSWPSFLKYLINTLTKNSQSLFLILDDYHVISEQVVHSSMSYFLEHLPAHMHVVVSTRTDPPWPLPRFRARRQLQEIRMRQLGGTSEEIHTFFSQVMHIELPSQLAEEVTVRTEGWMVGAQLLALSLRGRADTVDVLDILRGHQRDIFDYLIEEVFTRQSVTVQNFLLRTSILERLHSSCCDAVLETRGSQEMLELLERTNLFVVPLDQQRQWYRYHHLFAEALRMRLERSYEEHQIRALHSRASLWFSRHGFPREAIRHALSAQEWELAADVIEQMSREQMWGSQHVLLRQWIEQLPPAVIRNRPRICLKYAFLLFWSGLTSQSEYWLDEAEKMLVTQNSKPDHTAGIPHEQQLIDELTLFRALAAVMRGDGQLAITLYQKNLHALPLRTEAAFYLAQAYYLCDNVMLAVQHLRDAVRWAEALEDFSLENMATGLMVQQLSLLGRLKEAWSIGELVAPSQNPLLFASVSWPYIYQADILREWNKLDDALDLAEQAIQRGKETGKNMLLPHWYAYMARIIFSKGDLKAMDEVLLRAEQLNDQMDNPTRLGFYIILERVRLWIVRGELMHANRWAQGYLQEENEPSQMARVFKDMALIRVRMANAEYTEALKQLDMQLQQARNAGRESHVIQLLLLQALSLQAIHEDSAALESLEQALRLARPEGYIRAFVDEGAPLAKLLYTFKHQRHEQAPYIDTLLAAFDGSVWLCCKNEEEKNRT